MYPVLCSHRHLVILLIGGLIACGQPEQTEPPETESSQDVVPNTLTQSEIDAGWQLLFDGNTLTGWHKYGGEPVGAAWTVEDGAITLVPAELDDWQAKEGGDIVTDSLFEDFELSLEWKISAGGNSGIMYMVHESDEYEYPWQTGLEMQVLDNDGHPEGQYETHRAGDLYDLIAAPDGLTLPFGEWNQVRIRKARGKRRAVAEWITRCIVRTVD